MIPSNESAIENLVQCVKHGLPACYKDAKDWAWDFFPDLPWNKALFVIAARDLIRNHGPLLEEFEKKFNYPLREELQKGIVEANA